MPVIELHSFGWKFLDKDNQPPPNATYVEDVRRTLRNPAVDPKLLQLDGRNPRLQQVVLATPGAEVFVAKMIATIEGSTDRVRLAIGCVAGRHRSVALVEIIARQLRQKGYTVTVVHQHLARALQNEPLP